MKKFIAVLAALSMILSLGMVSFAAETAPVQTAKAAIPQEVKDKKATLENLNTQAQQLRNSIQAAVTSIRQKEQAVKDSIKNTTGLSKDQIKALKDKIKTFRSSVADFRAQVKETYGDLKSETASMQQFRESLKTAMKSGDYTTSENLLDQMIQTKTVKISNLQKIVDLKNAILNALGSAL